MIEKIDSILKEFGYPTKYLIRPKFEGKQNVVISFHDYNRRGAYYGDGKRKQFTCSLQVDLFYKRSIGDLDKEIIKKLEDNDFKFISSGDYDDTLNGVRLYHTILEFTYLEREV